MLGSVLLSHDIPRTIIGAKAFHFPVRDGKEWDHLAIAAKQKKGSLVLICILLNVIGSSLTGN